MKLKLTIALFVFACTSAFAAEAETTSQISGAKRLLISLAVVSLCIGAMSPRAGVIAAGRRAASGGGVPAPIAYWKLDATSGTTAADSSGNALNGTTQNSPSWVTGDLPTGGTGYCLELNGTNQWVQLPNSATLRPTTFSIGFWAKNADGPPTVAARYFFALTQNDVWIRTNDSGSVLTARMQFHPGGGATASSNYTANTWTYFLLTYDGATSTATLYQAADGGSLSSVASGTFTLTWEAGSTAAIGSLTGGTGIAHGKMWHFQIWNTVLDATQRAAAFAQR